MKTADEQTAPSWDDLLTVFGVASVLIIGGMGVAFTAGNALKNEEPPQPEIKPPAPRQ